MNPRLVLLALPVLALGILAAAPQPQDKQATPAAAPSTDPELLKLRMFQGVWSGEVDGDGVEETWSAPMGDSMIGMFRWQHAGKTTLFETLAITAEDGGLVLRLRHFGAKLEPWKDEAKGVAAMKATEVSETKAIFENKSETGGLAACEYRLQTPRQIEVRVKFKDPARETLVLVLKKAK